jgi:hypothetical protein
VGDDTKERGRTSDSQFCVLIQAMHALNIHPMFRDVHMSAGRGGND